MSFSGISTSENESGSNLAMSLTSGGIIKYTNFKFCLEGQGNEISGNLYRLFTRETEMIRGFLDL